MLDQVQPKTYFKTMKIEQGVFYYLIAVGNPYKRKTLQVHGFHKYTYRGYTFYLNLSRDEETNEYRVTESDTGYSVLMCPTNDPYIIKHQLKDRLDKNWDKFVSNHTVVMHHTKPDLLFNLLLCGNPINF